MKTNGINDDVRLKLLLDDIAVIGKSKIEGSNYDVYYSKIDGSYLTMKGMEDNLSFLLKFGITEQIQSCRKNGNTASLGFNPKEKKWYGWSHRAIYGFGIGSICKKGDCGYVASTPEGLIDDHANFFGDISKEEADKARSECKILDDRSGIRVLPMPLELPVCGNLDILADCLDDDTNSPDLEIIDLNKNSHYIIKCGKGEWTAKTLDDAKQMAIDFSEGVS